MIDLSNLPPPSVVEPLDYETILAASKADLIELMPTISDTLEIESEPITKLLEVFAYRELLLRARINSAAQSVLLQFAAADMLDHIGVTYFITSRLELESDDEYRARLALAIDAQGSPGSKQYYEFHARSSSPDVLDVVAANAGSGAVRVTIIDRNGSGAASAPLLSAVTTRLADETIRLLNDAISIESATILPYGINATLTVAPGAAPAEITAAAQAAAARYAERQHRIGRAVLRDAILAALWIDGGVENVVLHQPVADLVVGPRSASYCTQILVQAAP